MGIQSKTIKKCPAFIPERLLSFDALNPHLSHIRLPPSLSSSPHSVSDFQYWFIIIYVDINTSQRHDVDIKHLNVYRNRNAVVS